MAGTRTSPRRLACRPGRGRPRLRAEGMSDPDVPSRSPASAAPNCHSRLVDAPYGHDPGRFVIRSLTALSLLLLAAAQAPEPTPPPADSGQDIVVSARTEEE